MTDALMLGWSQAQAAGRKSVYRKALGFNMVLHLLIGLGCMFLPDFVSQTFGLPTPVPTGWIRGWGATLINGQGKHFRRSQVLESPSHGTSPPVRPRARR